MIYNQLSHITEAQHTLMPKVPQILDVISKYGLQNKIGVARLHKHFELQPNEFVVWRLSKDGCESRVSKYQCSPMCFAFNGDD